MDQERMMILRLLEEKKITAEEAAELLRALEATAPPRAASPSGGAFAFGSGGGVWTAVGSGGRGERLGRRAEELAERVPEIIERVVGRLEFGGLPFLGSAFRFDETVEGELDPELTEATLAVATANGRLAVRGGEDARRVRIVLHKTVRAPSEGEARARAEALGTARIEGGRVVVEGHAPGWWGGGHGLAVDILVPAAVLWSGALRTSNGRVEVEGLRVRGLEVTTSNGAVRLLGCSGEDLEARTSNGRIEARRVGGRVGLQTSNGSIEVQVEPSPGDNLLRLQTSNGSIRVEGPAEGVGWQVEAATTGGRVHCQLPGVTVTGGGSGWGRSQAAGATPDFAAQARRVRCEARTHNGSITIDAR